jgi:L-rhamnose mutarotase
MLDEYLRRHDPVWPEMLREIAASGRRNYSIFHRGGGKLIGYFETDDLEASTSYLAQSEIAERWEADMTPFFIAVEGRADQNLTAFPEVFNLADQLTQAPPESA